MSFHRMKGLNGIADGLSQGQASRTVVYPDVSPQMAMKIDGEYAFKWMTRGKFLRQAEKLGLAPRTMGKEIDRMVKRIAKHAPAVAAKLSNRFPCACYSRIIDGVLVRSRQLDALGIP